MRNKFGTFPTNIPNIKNWDYERNKPILVLDNKEFSKLLKQYFDSLQNKFPRKIYPTLQSSLSMWTHELTHHFDNIHNPRGNLPKEIASYKLPSTPRTIALVSFLCDIRSDSITQWRDAQIMANGKHIHPAYNGIMFNSSDYFQPFNEAKAKIHHLISGKKNVIQKTLGRVFANEYYAIGKFYLVLLGIFRSIENKIPYFVYSERGNRIFKFLEKENRKIFKLFGRYLKMPEIEESRLEQVFRSYPEYACLEISKKYGKENKNYLKDIEYYWPKYHENMIILPKGLEFDQVKKNNPELANVIFKLNYVSHYYFQKIGLIYWQLQRLDKSGPKYVKLNKKYEKIKHFIIEKRYLFNFITGLLESRERSYQAGAQILNNKLLNTEELEILTEKNILKKVEINFSSRHQIGKLLYHRRLDKIFPKRTFFTIFDKKIVEDIFNKVHNIKTSLEFFRMMKELDRYFKIPPELQLFQSEEELMEVLKRAAELDFMSIQRKGFELSKEEIKKYFSNL